mgnify:CR=1 FL=1
MTQNCSYAGCHSTIVYVPVSMFANILILSIAGVSEYPSSSFTFVNWVAPKRASSFFSSMMFIVSGIDAHITGFSFHSPAIATDKTGVEMEALIAATVTSLTIYDMLKAVDKKIIITDIVLDYKNGGRSGKFVRD